MRVSIKAENQQAKPPRGWFLQWFMLPSLTLQERVKKTRLLLV